MNISVSSLSFTGLYFSQLATLPEDVGIEILCECGNDYYWDSQLAICMKNRIGALSLHGPFLHMDISSLDLSENIIYQNYKWAFQLALRHKAKYIVAHPCANLLPTSDKTLARNTSLKRLELLAYFSNKYQIPLCIENIGHRNPACMVYSAEDYTSIFDRFNNLYALLDIGHAHLACWNIPEIIAKLQDRLLAFHIHDNDGITDSHGAIYEGEIDWTPILHTIQSFVPDATLVLEYDNKPITKVLSDIEMLRELLSST